MTIKVKGTVEAYFLYHKPDYGLNGVRTMVRTHRQPPPG